MGNILVWLSCLLAVFLLAESPDKRSLAQESSPLPANAIFRFGSSDLTHQGAVTELRMSSNGKLLVSAGGNEKAVICAWDAATGKMQSAFSGTSISSISTSSKNNRVAAIADSAELIIFDIKGMRNRNALAAKEGRSFTEVTYSPNGDYLALVENGVLKILEESSFKLLGEMKFDNDRLYLATYIGDGKTIATATENSNEIVRWNVWVRSRVALRFSEKSGGS